MTKSNFGPYEPHAKGRYVLEWHVSPVEKRMAVYEVTGKRNDVYVECTTIGKGKWMTRHFFEHFVCQIKQNLGGRETKPTSKGWQRPKQPICWQGT